MKPFRLSRRAVLRGMAGGSLCTLALPALEPMLNSHGTAYAQDNEPLPKRFGVFFWGNGVRLDKWTPAESGAGYQLTEELSGLASVKDYVSIVSGMRIRSGNEQGHHAGCVGILSGSPMISQPKNGAPYVSTFSAPSIDQVVAAGLGDVTRFRSLELGVTRELVTGEGTTLRYLSHSGPDNANPPEYNAGALFDRVFGTGFTAPGGAGVVDPRLALRRSVLDAVRLDAADLDRRLGASDRMRLDQHLSSIRALENQIMTIEAAPPPPSGCALPARPGDIPRANREQIATAMADLLALSLACDQTRVFSIMYSGGVSLTVYDEVGASQEHHGLSHDEPGEQALVHAITTLIIDHLGIFLDRLRNTPEGDGNLLDRAAILASSDCAEGQPHSIDDYPIIVAGRAGGALVHPGVHYRSPNDENTSNVLLTLVQAMDIEADSFGNGGGQSSTTVGALQA